MPSLEQAYQYCQWLTRRHYENFPVASGLLPKALRPHVAAVYAFARSADDFADEERDPKKALARLANWREMLGARNDTHPIFIALADTIRRFDLPPQLFHDLLTAFERDVTVKRYAAWDDLLNNYCRYSANPVGRLVLLLFGHKEPRLHELSDFICTALQLTNFWQDLSMDLAKGRIYLPQELLRRHGVTEESLFQGKPSGNFAAAMEEAAGFTEELFWRGEALPSWVSGRLRWELRATWLGGMAVLKRTTRLRVRGSCKRPALGWKDKLAIGMTAISVNGGGGSAAYCRRVAGKSGSHFYQALWLLPPERREAMFAVYSFCRAVDDCVDEGKPADQARRELEGWRREADACFEGRPTHPITRALSGAVKRYNIPRQLLLDLIVGMEMDLEKKRYATFEELQAYCYHAAGVVGLMAVRVFGCRNPKSDEFAIALGTAFQLTNILRDAASDAQRGRVYLPEEDLKRFANPALPEMVPELLAFECERARGWFAKAYAAVTAQDRWALTPALAMAAVYRRLLDRIESAGPAALAQPIRLSTGEKLSLALRGAFFSTSNVISSPEGTRDLSLRSR
ncbi:MAG: squalene synthase HpnC [Candidatus Omnitrophica bacterium]|nr:squalene synthase HpnC [Candidatus Omnitrophota bacterium]